MAREAPASIEEVQARLAGGADSVLFVGGGTAMPPGPKAALEISSEKLDHLVEYQPADQVVAVEAGMTLQALQRELSRNGQRLALDPPLPEKATIGGIVAANSFGPLR
ncbi:MAG TPA: FAD-binding protein, partial [Myxococcales bacterium]|nr:FAD-binding protein [Myxococcales bacterium]